jgi:hypothetical protein
MKSSQARRLGSSLEPPARRGIVVGSGTQIQGCELSHDRATPGPAAVNQPRQRPLLRDRGLARHRRGDARGLKESCRYAQHSQGFMAAAPRRALRRGGGAGGTSDRTGRGRSSELLPRRACELAYGGANRGPTGAYALMISFVLSGYWLAHLKYVPGSARRRRHRPDTSASQSVKRLTASSPAVVDT